MNNNITTYLKYASLQMAAEALFDISPNNSASISYLHKDSLSDTALTKGNNRASKFTELRQRSY